MTRVSALGKIGKQMVRQEERVPERRTTGSRSVGFGDRLDDELAVAAIGEGEGDLIADVDVLDQVGLFDVEHHAHRLHVSRNIFMRDGDVVLLFADRADFSAGRIRLARRAARCGAGFSGLFLGF
jgi:hypothetical protein